MITKNVFGEGLGTQETLTGAAKLTVSITLATVVISTPRKKWLQQTYLSRPISIICCIIAAVNFSAAGL